jgi:hypothetical protein
MRFSPYLTIVVVLSTTLEALACYAPSPEQKVDWKVLVKRTNDIALAEVIEVTTVGQAVAIDPQGNTIYKLKVIETLKGKADPTFNLVGDITDAGQDTDFSKHKSKSFWNRGSAGRSPIRPDCVIPPTFKKGERYLVFLTKPYHFKSFELIKSDGDEWLKKVRDEAKKIN